MAQPYRYSNPPVAQARCEFRFQPGRNGDTRQRKHLEARLYAAFEAEFLEDGIGHPAEEIIAEALRSVDDQPVLDWFMAFCSDAACPSFAASVLRCLGRQENTGTISWRAEIVRGGLAMDDVKIRDAAVQAAESWRDRDILDILRLHIEPEPWLRNYILDVIDDLQE